MNTKARRKARALAIQALYEWYFTATPTTEITTRLKATCNPKKVDCEYFLEVVHGVVTNIEIIDQQISSSIDRAINKLNPIELAVMRLATYELLLRPDIPNKVAINEAIELTKIYGSTDGYKYVNGVLDKINAQRI